MQELYNKYDRVVTGGGGGGGEGGGGEGTDGERERNIPIDRQSDRQKTAACTV